MTGPSSGSTPDTVVGRGSDAPPRRGRLALWWLVAAGTAVGLVFAATDHMWRATAAFSASLTLAAVVRLMAPAEVAGGIAVRRRHIDVLILLVLAVAIAISGFTLDLTADP